jgi:undecaprenyl-diphosphatase
VPAPEGALATLLRWDERACVRLNRALRYRALFYLFRAVSRLGDGLFWGALMLALLVCDGMAAAFPVLHMVAVAGAATLVYRALKQGTRRLRPFEAHAHIAAGIAPLDRCSFPSGHTLHAVAFTTIALSYYPALAPLLLPFAFLVAASRIVLGMHYPTDVAAGALLGAALALASFALL